jgi:hypothetical protein
VECVLWGDVLIDAVLCVIRNAGMLAYRIGVSLIYVILLLLVARSILNSSSRVYLNFKCLSPVG